MTNTAKIVGFAPVVSAASRVLILGSMPGAASLQAGQYYAKPQNAFWPIMGALIGAGPALGYEARLRMLDAAGVALWDVLHDCTRPGSLDSAIRDAVPNRFGDFFASYPGIREIFFNGATAEALFLRHVPAGVLPGPNRLVRLPSSSPANARMGRIEKIAAWRTAMAGSGVAVPRTRM